MGHSKTENDIDVAEHQYRALIPSSVGYCALFLIILTLDTSDYYGLRRL